MNDSFFVILSAHNGGYMPLVDDDDIAKFSTEEEARECAIQNPLGEHFGYEIFEMGTGTT